jgi:SAM-dependent methyltransferase
MLRRREEPAGGVDYRGNPTLLEPFAVPRSVGRLLFDFGVMLTCMSPRPSEAPILDLGAGTGWITELLARMGRRVVAFDIHGDLEGCLQHRIDADLRIRPELMSYEHGDAHAMPFADGTFSHVFCYDTLHHMHDYARVFGEFARVLEPGGRAVFVEPGARHSSSPETIAFVRTQKAHDPTWIERDVVLDEIDGHARAAGFAGLVVRPMPHAEAALEFSLPEWRAYREGDATSRLRFAEDLAHINYNERVIFHCDRPS